MPKGLATPRGRVTIDLAIPGGSNKRFSDTRSSEEVSVLMGSNEGFSALNG